LSTWSIAFISLFAANSAVHLYSCYPTPKRVLRPVTKSFLMPTLIVCYCLLANNFILWVPLALFFSFLGDVFLIFKTKKRAFFLAGIGSFGLAHVAYIIANLSLVPRSAPLATTIAALAYAVVFGLLFMKSVYRYLPKNMKVAASFYSLLIISDSFFALRSLITVFSVPTLIVFIGSLLFIFSDYTLSMQYFKKVTKIGNFSVMFTYILAQACLAFGFALFKF